MTSRCAVATSVMIGVALCLGGASAQAQGQRPPLVVGLIAPLSGPLGFAGVEIRAGATLAAELINARGGAGGRRIELRLADDEGAPAAAATRARELLERDRVTAIVGLPVGAAALAVRPVAAAADVLVITLSSGAAVTDQSGSTVLRAIGREDRLARTVVDDVRVSHPGRPVAALLSLAAPGFAAAFRAAAEAAKLPLRRVDPVPFEGPPPGWSADGAVVVASPGLQLQAIERLVADKPGSPVEIAVTVARGPELALVRRGEAVRLVANPGADFFPPARELIDQARQRGLETGGYFVYGAAAVQIVAQLAESVPDTSGRRLAAAARERTIATSMGALRFDASGDLADWRFAVWTRTGGEVAAVDVCLRSDCRDYEQCPQDCPKK